MGLGAGPLRCNGFEVAMEQANGPGCSSCMDIALSLDQKVLFNVRSRAADCVRKRMRCRRLWSYGRGERQRAEFLLSLEGALDFV